MRMVYGWTVGILIFIAAILVISLIGIKFNVPLSVPFEEETMVIIGGGKEAYDQEVSSYHTLFGISAYLFSFTIALWAGRAVYCRKWNAGLGRISLLKFQSWIIALLFFLPLSVFIQWISTNFFEYRNTFINDVVELSTFLIMAFLAYCWFMKQKKQQQRR